MAELTATLAVPSAINSLPIIPSSTASNSIVAFSVSISARISPELTLSLVSYSTSGDPQNDESLIISSRIIYQGKEIDIKGSGNGPINAFVQALDQNGLKNFKLTDYRQHSIGEGSATRSATYIQLKNNSGLAKYGCGIDSSIEKSGILALVSAINRLFWYYWAEDKVLSKFSLLPKILDFNIRWWR